MLKYRINRRQFNKTRENLQVNNVSFVDFEELLTDENTYNDNDKNKILVVCNCDDVSNLRNGDKISTTNELVLTYGDILPLRQETLTFNNDYEITGINKFEKTFSFFIDKYITLEIEKIESGYNTFDLPELFVEEEDNNIFLHCKNSHYFDEHDNTDDEGNQEIPIYFRFRTIMYGKKASVSDDLEEKINSYDYDNLTEELKNNYEEIGIETVTEIVYFQYFDNFTLTTSYSKFPDYLYDLIFNTLKPVEEEDDEDDEETENEEETEEEEFETLEGKLVGIEIFRRTFLFTEKTTYHFVSERVFADINIPFSNTFDTNLLQTELLNEHFIENEKKKVINRVIDIEKDVYYPCIKTNTKIQDVYTIKFNLHFREHRGNDWITSNDSFWNGVELSEDYININNHSDTKTKEEYETLTDKDKLKYYREASINNKITNDNVSDLITFLNFTNDDIHYQKNKLKKSFLRLSFYDSTNPANQNLLSYSTIFIDSGALFSKYIKFFTEAPYTGIMFGDKFGSYTLTDNKIGIRVDREHSVKISESVYNSDFDENKRLSSQLVVNSKNTSKSSSDGFYLYLWKDDESVMPQDLYLKVEFNHAGYGRTIPFMMPFWDKRKHPQKIGKKTFQEIINDWNNINYVENTSDGRYGIKQYIKYSYIHLKYYYDKDIDKHYYYIDPDTYGEQLPNSNNEIIINLYEAKIV